jgi:VWFA-related protein
MRRVARSATTIAAASIALLPPAAVTPQAAAQQRPTFPAQAELVTVDVVVTDKSGAPVVGLRSEDFTVTEDGTAQEIASFDAVHRPAGALSATAPRDELRPSTNLLRPGQEPASFVFVFDELHLTPVEAERAREAVSSFLRERVADGDRVAIAGTAEGTRWTARIPEGREPLLQVLTRLQGKQVGESVRDAMSDYEAMRIDQDRDPIVTDQVMRRLLSTGEIRQDVSRPGQPVDISSELPGWRNQTQARAAQVYARARLRLEQTLGIVERSLEALADARGRKSLVLVTSGLVQDSRLAIFRSVVTQSRRANAAIYSVDARGLTAAASSLQADVGPPSSILDASTGIGLNEAQDASEGNEGLARDTGGFVIRNRNDLGDGLARIAREARSYYLIGYAPTNRSADGRFRRIGVKLAREDVVVRARRGYYAPGPALAGAKPEGRDAAIQRALNAPFDLPGIPLRALAQSFGEAEKDKTRALVTVEADIRGLAFEEQGGTARDRLELLLLVAHSETGTVTRFDQQLDLSLRPETRTRYERSWFPIVRELPLPAGPYQARIVVRDRNSGRVGSVTHDFQVPAPAGLRISSLMISDRLQDEGALTSRVPEPVARRSFAPLGLLHCRFEVYGAAHDTASGQPNLTAGFAIRRSDGRVLVAAPETPLRPAADGSLARSLGAPLEGAPPGRYEVIVQVTDLVAGQVAEMREAIRIGDPDQN